VLEDTRVLTLSERRTRVFYLPDAITPWPAQTVRWALDFAVGFFGPAPSRVRPNAQLSTLNSERSTLKRRFR
jgi:hypothetical protein